MREQPTAVLCGGLAMLRCFVGSAIPTMVVSSDPVDLTFYSRHCGRRRVIADPATEPERALAELCAIGQELGTTADRRPALFYGDDATLLLLSRGRERLRPWFRLRLPPAELLEALVDKAAFAALAARLALPVPKTVLSRDLGGPDEALRRIGLPCVLKPNHHVGWQRSAAVRRYGGKPRKALRADTPAEFAAAYAAISASVPEFLVQEYIRGDDTCIYSFHAYLDDEGRSLGSYVGRKLRTYPRDTGVSTYLELVDEPTLPPLGLEILRSLGLRGPVKIDFKRDPKTGRFLVLELNPRFNLWNYLGAACGVNLLRLAYEDLVGGSAAPAVLRRHDVRWLSLENDLRAFVRDYHHDGDLSWLGWLGSLSHRKVYDIFAWDDPLPAVMSSLRYGRALGRRLLRELRH